MPEPTEKDLSKMHWKDRWEYEATRTFENLTRVPEQELLRAVSENRLDAYYAIWEVYF